MDGMSPAGLLKVLLPKAPLLLKTTAAHTLGVSETSHQWDLKTEVIIKLVRSFLSNPRPTRISRVQQLSMADAGIKGPLWVAKVELPPPAEDDARALLDQAMRALGGPLAASMAAYSAVGAEWTGHRFRASDKEPRLDVPEPEQYARLMQDVRSDATVLYLHGGAMYLLDPASYRPACAQLAKRTGGRCLSVRYRLAPQHAFPAALLDCLVAYLSLLYPAPGALHEAVPPERIVVSGDSAGGNLSLGLLQTLLQINRTCAAGQTLRFHGHDVALPLPLPAGLALNSPWMDLTSCMPSCRTHTKYDYMPALGEPKDMVYKPDAIWPATPPRSDLYCDRPQLVHPLVSPLAARDWSGACPVFMVYGEEILVDEGRAVAGILAAQGVPLEWWEFQAMPHVFCILLMGMPVGRLCFDKWAAFIRRVTGVRYEYASAGPATPVQAEEVGAEAEAPSLPATLQATAVDLPSLRERPITREEMCPFSVEEIDRRLQEALRWREERAAEKTAPPAPAAPVSAKL